MLFKLAVRNIARSVKDYAVYFFTLIVGVAVFYVFNAIGSQTAMLSISSSTEQLVELMIQMLSGVSVFVSFVLGFLIVYASRFLMKRRSREFAIYLLLGMGKHRVSLILFFETLLVGFLSLAAGLLAGVGLSQLMSIFVANLFEADMTAFTFVFSAPACRKTVLCFGILYLVVLLFQTVMAGKLKLIDLLQAGRRSERLHMKNPWLCVNVFLIGATILGFAYYQVTAGLGHLQKTQQILVPIGLGCLGTFLVFWSLSGLLLKLMQARKSHYYKGLNSFTLRQVGSQVNTAVCSMTVICIMLFVTICVLSSGLSIRNSMQANLDELAPADIQMYRTVNLAEDIRKDSYTKQQLAHYDLSILETLDALDFHFADECSEYLVFYVYRTPELVFADTMGEKLQEIQESYAFLNYHTEETILRLSDYNRVAEFYGKETFTLGEGEYLIVADFESMVQVRNACLADGAGITVFGQTFTPKYDECRDGFIELSSNHINGGIIVLPDDAVDESAKYGEYLVANYTADSREGRMELEERINVLMDSEPAKEYVLPNANSRLAIAEAATGLGALVTFIALYLGVVFLISGAAILSLKELSESADNVERYRMLRRIGADERMLNAALLRQIGVFFLFPLALAVIHSVFGMKFSMLVLEGFGTEKMPLSICVTAVILAAIYGGYFVITYRCSRRMIREPR